MDRCVREKKFVYNNNDNDNDHDNRIYNKILDCDWVSACLFETYSARNHVGVQLDVSNLNVL